MLTFFQTEVISLWKVQVAGARRFPEILGKIHSKELVNDLWAQWIIMGWKSVTHYLTAWKWHCIYYCGPWLHLCLQTQLLMCFNLFAWYPTTELIPFPVYSAKWFSFLTFGSLVLFIPAAPTFVSASSTSFPPTCVHTDTLFVLIKAVWVLQGSRLPKYVSAH